MRVFITLQYTNGATGSKPWGKEAFLAYESPARGRGVKKISKAREKAVLDTWKRYPGFGPSQIRNRLRRRGVAISTRTVSCLMEANGYKGPRKKQKQEETRRFEATRPLELAQIYGGYDI